MKLAAPCLACLAACALTGRLAAAEPEAPSGRVVVNSIGIKLALIPAGTFWMGSPETEKERDEEERRHEVVITKPFYLGVYEVTQLEFQKGKGQSGRSGAFFDQSQGGGPDHPVENIPRQAAIDFCNGLSALPAEQQAGRAYRLPTEAEWEYACRAGTGTPFHMGDSLSSQQANFNGEYPYGGAAQGPYLRRTAKVGAYPPNAFGLYDMHGNVAEWCADWYDKDYYRRSPREDPQGPAEGVLPTGFGNYYVVVRGGCWLDEAGACRSAYRLRAMPENAHRLIGFRVACDIDGKR